MCIRDRQQLTVRSYLWATQSYCFRYGSAGTINEEPVTADKLNHTSFPTVFDEKEDLNNGYIIELVSFDGENSLYNILYSTILEAVSYTHLIPKLGDNSTLSAKAMLGGSYHVKMLTLRETKAAALNDITQIENYALGLFKINDCLLYTSRCV